MDLREGGGRSGDKVLWDGSNGDADDMLQPGKAYRVSYLTIERIRQHRLELGVPRMGIEQLG